MVFYEKVKNYKLAPFLFLYKSRADPLYYAGIVMITVGTLVLLCYFVVRGAHDQIRGASRVVAEG